MSAWLKITTFRAPAGIFFNPPCAFQKDETDLYVKYADGTEQLIKTDPTWQVTGVLGNAALVNGQWMEKGKPNGNVTVKEIGANKVVLLIDGQPREFQVWPAMP